jgi:hypothetical protein
MPMCSLSNSGGSQQQAIQAPLHCFEYCSSGHAALAPWFGGLFIFFDF